MGRRIPKAENHPCMVGWQQAARLSTGPLHVVTCGCVPGTNTKESGSLSAFQEAVSKRDGGASQTSLSCSAETDDTWKAGAPFPTSVWPCTPSQSTGIPRPAVRPSTGRTTHFPGHPGRATLIPAGASTPQWTSCWLERKAEAELYEVAIFLGQGREKSFIFM